jgi:hypothetical protein
LSDGAARRYYPTASNSTSNTTFAFGGIRPGTPFSRYAKCGPTQSRRRPPTRIPPNAPYEARDGVALANRERGDHVGLERLATIEGAAVADGDGGTAQGHGSVADLQLFDAEAG